LPEDLGRKAVGKYLSNLRIVAWASLAIAVVYYLVYAVGVVGLELSSIVFWRAALRWAHVVSGVMWIGLLWYFNFVQIPNVPKIPEEARGPAISKVIAPAALYWFRWGAVATLVTGLALAWANGYIVQTLTLGASTGFDTPGHIFLGIGMWLAIIMFINVWAVIWPNQQKALNINDAFKDLTAEQRGKHARTAMLFSRTNTLLSGPMLIAMAASQTLGVA
jgi:uncharacterized membrane protein